MTFTNSVFNQFLSLIPRSKFEKIVSKYDNGRKSKKFGFWSQFVHLLFIQITERKSLRAGILSMSVSKKQLYHLGAKPTARSTFSDENNTRSTAVFEALFNDVLKQASAVASKHDLPFNNNKGSWQWAIYI